MTVAQFKQITPKGNPLAVPFPALADAIEQEWQGQTKFALSKMPLTALAYTALDRIAGQEGAIVEALMTYIDTDTLSYRSNQSGLRQRQDKEWGEVLLRLKELFGVTWEVTEGVMPLEQPPELHEAVNAYLSKLDAFRLAGISVLASGFSSLALAIAYLEGHLDAQGAYQRSRLEEEWQAETWGRDEEAQLRALRLKEEIMNAARFLRLLQPI